MNKDQIPLKIWLKEQLEKKGRGAKARLAEYLGIRRAAVFNMINLDPSKEMRLIKADELVKIIEFFEEVPACVQANSYKDQDFWEMYERADDRQKQIVHNLLRSLLE
ncbi:XRE family transcriptional regulator [Bartonella sp. DGB2]|uniref:XRE family transcriptional regulator n=1 Tax=Bartonella sp. DGB2 TaxID=3388426 RepID=UPI003990013E